MRARLQLTTNIHSEVNTHNRVLDTLVRAGRALTRSAALHVCHNESKQQVCLWRRAMA